MMQLLEHFKELTLHPKNAEELKGLILQLAVQGKLTRQWREENPDVETASVLLERIRLENNNHVRANKFKKNNPFPSITEYEIPCDLPKGWEFCQLGDIIKISSGNGLTSSKMDKSGQIPVYGGNGITGYHSSGNVEDRTIVIGRVGFYCGSIHLTEKNAWVTDNAFITRYSKENIDRDFLVWLLKGTNLKKNENATAQPVISGRKVYPINISLPPLEEQKAVVEVVNQLFAEVEQLEALTKERIQLKADFVTSALNQLTQAAERDTARQWAFLQEQFGTFFTEKSTIKKLREGILQLAVQGKLTHNWRSELKLKGIRVEPAAILVEKIEVEKQQLIKAGKIKKEKPLPEISEEEIPYELPEGWVWCRFSKITNWFSTGPFGTMLHKSDYVNNGIPVINPQQMVDGNIVPSINMQISNETKMRLARYVLKEGNIIVARRGEMGRCAIITKKEEGFLCGTGSFFMDLNHEINRKFIYLLFQSGMIREYLIQASNGATMSNLNQTTLLNMIIPLPPIEEQKSIVEKVNTLMTLCDKLEQEIETHQITQEQWMQSCLREVI